MAFTFVPTNANSIDVQIGIAHLLEGFIIRDESIEETIDKLEIPDQQGRTAQVFAYQKRYNFSLTVTGPATSAPFEGAAKTASWYTPSGASVDYVVDSVSLQCTYNDTAKYSVTGTAYINATYHDATDSAL